MVWLGLTLTAGIVLAGDLLGASSATAQLLGPIAVGLSAAVAAASISFLYSAAERQWRLAAHVSAAAALNVALNLILIPEHGALGAAYATAISFATLFALHVAGLDRSILEDRPFVALGLFSLALTILVGIGSSMTGGWIWPVIGFIAAIALVPLALRSVRLLIPAIDTPAAA
jgi:O-antigen/teichoic acid export membrane protein